MEVWDPILIASSLETPVVFIPRTTPLPPSELRQQAYKENIPLPLPHDDPSGWLSLPQVRVKGVIPTDQIPMEVVYTVCHSLFLGQFDIHPIPSFHSQHLYVGLTCPMERANRSFSRRTLEERRYRVIFPSRRTLRHTSIKLLCRNTNRYVSIGG